MSMESGWHGSLNRETSGAELAVIGSMLIDDDCRASMLDKLKQKDFAGQLAAEAFGIMVKLEEDGKPVDYIIVAEMASNAEVMQKYLLAACEYTVTTANADEYAALVKRNAMIRRLAAIGDTLAMTTHDDAKAVAAQASEDINRVIDQAADAEVVGGDVWADLFTAEESKIIDDPDAAMCRTGISSLDNILGGGMFNGGLYFLGARPGMGKTTIALNIAEAIAKRGCPVLYISLEMSARQIMCKRLSALQNIPYCQLMSGRISWDERVEMDEGLAILRSRPFNVNRRFGLTVNDIAAMSRHVRGCKLVVVDYFGLIAVEGDGRGRYEDYTAISGRLKQMACQLDIPVLCLAQLNRETEKRNSKRPTLSDLRDTGAIEQDADGVIFLHREGYYAENEKPAEEKIDLIVAKNRHGETGTVSLWWQGAYGRVAQIDRREDDVL